MQIEHHISKRFEKLWSIPFCWTIFWFGFYCNFWVSNFRNKKSPLLVTTSGPFWKMRLMLTNVISFHILHSGWTLVHSGEDTYIHIKALPLPSMLKKPLSTRFVRGVYIILDNGLFTAAYYVEECSAVPIKNSAYKYACSLHGECKGFRVCAEKCEVCTPLSILVGASHPAAQFGCDWLNTLPGTIDYSRVGEVKYSVQSYWASDINVQYFTVSCS